MKKPTVKKSLRENGSRKGPAATVFKGDCMKLLAGLPNDSVDLTLTSPPYCMGKAYEKSSSLEDFISAHERVLPEVVRVTKPGGHICWQVGYHVRQRVVAPLDYFVFEVLSKVPGLFLRNRIIWTFGHGHHEGERFSGRHEVILWFSKGDKYFFDLDAVRVPQKYPGKRHYKGPKKGLLSGNPLGKNPGDVWEIPNVKAGHPEKTAHPCQFPVGLASRVVASLSPLDGLVLDPFCGSGSTGVAAIMLGRNFVGAETDNRYCKIARERFVEAKRGRAKIRPIERPLLVPSSTDAVAKRPAHFLRPEDVVL